EVQRVGVAKYSFVNRVDARDHLGEVVLGLGCELRRSQQLVLGVGDPGGEGLGWKAFLVEVELLHRPLDRGQPVSLVVDDVAAIDADQLSVATQDAATY